MNRIDQTFKKLHQQKKKAFIAFITAGDPNLKATYDLVLALEQAGADIIELGVPFSDPMADGPTIQASSMRALQKGTSLKKVLDLVKQLRRKTQIPLCLMTYYNIIFAHSEEQFVKDAVACGVDGIIIPDLPVTEAGTLRKLAGNAGLATVFFVAPTTSSDRIKPIAQASSGFIYYVSLTGVTGTREALPSTVIADIKRIKNHTNKPVCVGFGISRTEHVRKIGAISDGVIVGSAIINEIVRNAGKRDLVKNVCAYVSRLVKVLKEI